MRVRIVVALMLLTIPAAQALAQQLPVPSVWKNQRKSILTISSINSSGNFKGKYWNRAQGYPCHDVYDVAGVRAGSRITFVVTWKNQNPRNDCRSVTAWRGTVAGNRLSTNWELAYGNPATGKLELKRGVDIFLRQ